MVNSNPGRRNKPCQRHREKGKWIYLLFNVHIEFPVCAEALIDKHYEDFDDSR